MDLMAQCRKNGDLAACQTLPPTLANGTYIQGSAGGELYWLRCTPLANKLVVFLHTWSGDLNQIKLFPEFEGIERACLVSPNFNGPNNTAQAMGSDDSVTRINTVIQEAMFKTGLSRIYLVGASGGSMAAMNYLAAYPGRVHRASLWLPIWDLAGIYNTTSDAGVKADIVNVLGIPTGPNDPAFLARSPRGRFALAPMAPSETVVYLNAAVTDITSPLSQATAARDQMAAKGLTVVYKEWPMGHVFDPPQRLEAIKQLILE